MKTRIPSVRCRHLQSQEEVAGVLHTQKLQLRLIQRARCQQQPLHLNADGSVVCVMRLGIIKEVALISITPQLRTFFYMQPLTSIPISYNNVFML